MIDRRMSSKQDQKNGSRIVRGPLIEDFPDRNLIERKREKARPPLDFEFTYTKLSSSPSPSSPR